MTSVSTCANVRNGTPKDIITGEPLTCASYTNNSAHGACLGDSTPAPECSTPDAGDGGAQASSCQGKSGCVTTDLPTTECKNGVRQLCHDMSTRYEDGTTCNASKQCVPTGDGC